MRGDTVGFRWSRGISVLRNTFVECSFYQRSFLVLGAVILFAAHAERSQTIVNFENRRASQKITLVAQTPTDLQALRTSFSTLSKRSIQDALDSLGFFDYAAEFATPDSIVYRAGTRYRIDTITFASPVQLPSDSLFTVQFPIPYDARLIRATSEKAIDYFAATGYPFARVSTNISKDTTSEKNISGEVTVHFEIDPNGKYLFGQTVIRGSRKTRIPFLIRDVNLPPGTPFDIRKIRSSLDRLTSRPYIAHAEAGAPFVLQKDGPLDDTVAQRVVVPILIEDKSGLGVDGAITAENSSEARTSLSGVLDVTLLNAFGRGEQASLSYRGRRAFQLFDLSFSIPWIAGTPLWTSAGFGLEIKEQDYGHIRGNAEVLTELKPLWQAGFGIRGHETTIDSIAGQGSLSFIGADLILNRSKEPYRKGTPATMLRLRTGTGNARSAEKSFTRWSIDFSGGRRVPFGGRYALNLKISAKNLFTPEKKLPPVEMFRVGGHRSLRGYSTDEFAFKSVALLQSEVILFFAPVSSVYLLLDGGIGFPEGYSGASEQRVDLLGYGVGTRLPTRLGTISVEWARNHTERRGFGRIHVRFQNPLAPEPLL